MVSHQIEVESDELQPRHQGQEESQVIMAADQGVPVTREGTVVAWGLVASLALPHQQACGVEI